MFYRNIFSIKVDKDCPKDIVNSCPQKILVSEGNKIVAKEEYNCDMCESCLDACKKLGKDSIIIEPTDELVITLESFGQIDTEDMFRGAINEFKKDLSEVSKVVSK